MVTYFPIDIKLSVRKEIINIFVKRFAENKVKSAYSRDAIDQALWAAGYDSDIVGYMLDILTREGEIDCVRGDRFGYCLTRSAIRKYKNQIEYERIKNSIGKLKKSYTKV